MEIIVKNQEDLKDAVNSLKNGDTLVLSAIDYPLYKERSKSKHIHFTNTDSFKNPVKHFGILLENLSDITIDGNGARLCIYGDMCALALINCSNVRLKNFTINYPCPSNAELWVKQVNGNEVIYSIPNSLDWSVEGKKITFAEKSPLDGKVYWSFKNGENSYCGVCHTNGDVYRTQHIGGAFFGVNRIDKLDDNTVKITYIKPKSYKPGDVYTFSQNWNRNTCGAFFGECKDIMVEDVTVNYLAGFGWLTQMCENVSYKGVKFMPDDNHTVSSFADLIHVCGCKGRVDISDCYFAHPHDDAINIHGTFLRFKKRLDDKTAVFEFVHNQQGGHRAFFKGDRVRFYYRNSLKPLGDDYIVTGVKDNIKKKLVTVEFDRSLPADIGCKYRFQHNVVAENVSYCPDVEVKNCTFEHIPTRGILCTTSGKVKIHNNKFSQVYMANIFISNDANLWYESGPVKDFEIYENEFVIGNADRAKDTDIPAVLVEPITLGGKVKIPVHSNISIHHNIINSVKKTAIKAIGVEALHIADNNIVNNNKIELINTSEI